MLENRLKKVVEEADDKKARRQVIESTLQEKIREVAQTEKKLVTIERAWDSAD